MNIRVAIGYIGNNFPGIVGRPAIRHDDLKKVRGAILVKELIKRILYK